MTTKAGDRLPNLNPVASPIGLQLYQHSCCIVDNTLEIDAASIQRENPGLEAAKQTTSHQVREDKAPDASA